MLSYFDPLGELSFLGVAMVVAHVIVILCRFLITPNAYRLGVLLGATQKDRFANAGYRIVVHIVGLMAHYANGNAVGRTFESLTPGVSAATDRLLYLPAFVWSAMGAFDTLEAARKPGKPGEGADMIFHHIMTITLIVLSWYSGMQAYGALLLAVHALAEPFIDLYRMVSSIPTAPDTLHLIANVGAGTVFPYTRCVTFYFKCVGPMSNITPVTPVVRFCLWVMWPMYILQFLWGFYMVKLLFMRYYNPLSVANTSDAAAAAAMAYAQRKGIPWDPHSKSSSKAK